jgi:hypothetical protein
MRRGFGQYDTSSGLDTSGVVMGNDALNALPFGGSVIAAETPIQGGVTCSGSGCSSTAPSNTSTILILILGAAAIVGMFIAGGKH